MTDQMNLPYIKNYRKFPFSVWNRNLVVVNSSTNASVSGVNVALIPYTPALNTNSSFQEILDASIDIGTTDMDGKVRFENVPANFRFTNEYGVLVYFDNINYQYVDNNFPNDIDVSKGSNLIYNVVVSL